MPVTTRHEEYLKNIRKWKRCRDAIAGEDAIKAADTVSPDSRGGLRKTTYLPIPGEWSGDRFEAYKDRAYWYNATRRTWDGMTGLVFRRDPSFSLPGGLSYVATNVDHRGTGLVPFSKILFREVLATGRAGVLVDFPSTENTENLTLAEYEALNLVPFARAYRAEDIVNWRTENVNGVEVVVLVVLMEAFTEAGEDRFSFSDSIQYRVLELTENGYEQAIYRKGENSQWREVSRTIPTVNGQPWRTIPFVWFGSGEVRSSVESPPLLDLVNVNISHYRNIADLENGAHLTGVPTPVFVGLPPDQEKVVLGGAGGISIPSPNGDAKYLEFTGKGLDQLRDLAKWKEEQMARLAARILATEKKSAEAAETEAIRRAGENSILASIANGVSFSMKEVLVYMARWATAQEDVSFELNTDYMPEKLEPNMITAILKAYQGGAMTLRDVFDAFKRGEVVSADRDYEEFREDLDAEAPQEMGIGESGAA